ncbi:hypothetical protein [Deinococcus soli (ex Cha et al. 2016)]|uniref:Uncharacterized protein n=2 Tax=Deinococcus soli (ex Cha et al. 2016) TaxID=1309411 RepID=A0ACC6KHA9_9DEIO|nr:hypothetical protein [Deinococcus soli (ex Cha et al. 2016)]MDR6751957.1 hypothetical protein [Deinococcus soli (ex Cha et al. 2016)]
MLTCPDHMLALDSSAMSRYGSPFDDQMLEAVLGSVTDEAVLRLLRRAPLKSLTFRSNPGAPPGTNDGGHVVINTAPRLPPSIGITHEYAQTDVAYYSLVLLHEIAHVVANQLTGTGASEAAHQAFLEVFQKGGGVTRYALNRCGEGRTLSEYFAETFTAAVALPQLRANDPEGFDHMSALLGAVRDAPA